MPTFRSELPALTAMDSPSVGNNFELTHSPLALPKSDQSSAFLASADVMERRGTKRAAGGGSTDAAASHKRRAPYALRACIACRHRKGKCDGRLPCAYCESRTQSCTYDGEYATETNAGQDNTSVPGPRQADADAEARSATGASSFEPVTLIKTPSNYANSHDIDMASIHNGLASLRAQLIRVESALGECAQSGDGRGQAAPPQARPGPGPGPDPAPHSEPASEGPHRGFCGPTSPEYSMNVVRMTLRKRGCLTPPPQHQPALPCFDPDHATPSEPHPWQQPCRAEDQRQLRQFRSRLTLVDAREAVSVYSEVVGDLHDFVDIGSMQDQLSVWYSRSPADGPHPPSDFVHLIIFNLMLAIAARAGTNTSYAASASTMQTVLRSAVDASITSCTPTIKQVTIALLLGHYHIFHDRPQLALRMFGAAGRILMELGIHSGDVIEHVLDTEAQRKEAYRLVCSTVVLDRQWSAMTGLPPNFLPHAFSLRPSYLANSPYSMAMYRLVLMSDKFNEIISLAANKGLGDVDDDTVEVMRFQIRQWQAKAIGEHSVDDLEAWLDHPTLMPQPWALLLIFRASSIHSLLLRSYFFPGSPIDRSRGHVAPATELLSQSIAALAALDASACVFGKHRPYYQHILNSMCALVFLMIGYVHDHRPALSAHLPPDFDGVMRRCLEDAACLAGRYAAVSTAAHRLQKRIKEVCRAADTDAAMSNGGSNAQGSSRTARRSSGSTGTVPIGQRSMRPAAQGQTAAVQVGAPCETDPYIFDTNLHLEFSTEMDSCLSQDFQAWGQPIWPSTWDSYLFR